MLFSFKASSSEQTQKAIFPSLIQPKLNIWRMMEVEKGKNFYPYKNAEVRVSSWREYTKRCHNNDPRSPFLVPLQWMYYRSKIKPQECKILSSSRFTIVSAPNMCIFRNIKITSHPFMLCISSMYLWRDWLWSYTLQWQPFPQKSNEPKIKRSLLSFSPKHLSNVRRLKH